MNNFTKNAPSELSRIWGTTVFWVNARRQEYDRKVTLFYIKKNEAIKQCK